MKISLCRSVGSQRNLMNRIECDHPTRSCVFYFTLLHLLSYVRNSRRALLDENEYSNKDHAGYGNFYSRFFEYCGLH
jgi:hypothetical protein